MIAFKLTFFYQIKLYPLIRRPEKFSINQTSFVIALATGGNPANILSNLFLYLFN
jgi:hypothetical protein